MSTVSYTCSYTSRTDARKSLCSTFCRAASLVTGTSPAKQMCKTSLDICRIANMRICYFSGAFPIVRWLVLRLQKVTKIENNYITRQHSTFSYLMCRYSPLAKFNGSPATAIILFQDYSKDVA